jgi:hypothetical protein
MANRERRETGSPKPTPPCFVCASPFRKNYKGNSRSLQGWRVQISSPFACSECYLQQPLLVLSSGAAGITVSAALWQISRTAKASLEHDSSNLSRIIRIAGAGQNLLIVISFWEGQAGTTQLIIIEKSGRHFAF